MRYCLIVVAIVACFVGPFCLGEQNKQDGKRIVRQDGDVQGMWDSNDKCQMALITRHAQNEKSDPEIVPYVAVYLKDKSGKLDSLPYAMNMGGGELMLQIPRVNGDPVIVPMRRVVALLEAAKQLHNQAK